MTVREAFENCLIELNKVQAPSLLIDDFVYLFNKAIQRYINKRYNLFEKSQQLTDDLRVLTRTIVRDSATLTQSSSNNVFGVSYTCTLPSDYVHILSCICQFRTPNTHCNDSEFIEVGANKLGSAEWPHSIDNYYMQPSIRRPYYYISNIINPTKISTTTKVGGQRYGNTSIPTMQIKCGNAPLNAVFIDYLTAPEYITLDQQDLDNPIDTTPQLEFPDYVNYEIINEVVTLILENQSSNRIQTFPSVTPTIASK